MQELREIFHGDPFNATKLLASLSNLSTCKQIWENIPLFQQANHIHKRLDTELSKEGPKTDRSIELLNASGLLCNKQEQAHCDYLFRKNEGLSENNSEYMYTRLDC